VPFPAAKAGCCPDGPAAGTPSENGLKLVAAYARVSSDKQEKEQTIDSQVDALRRAAEERGWQLPPDLICTDDGRSGATLARPGLDRLRDLIAEGTCAAVLVCSPDRLARNLAYQVLAIDEFKRAGCEVVFLNHAFGDSPEQQMLLQMQGVFAEYERACSRSGPGGGACSGPARDASTGVARRPTAIACSAGPKPALSRWLLRDVRRRWCARSTAGSSRSS